MLRGVSHPLRTLVSTTPRVNILRLAQVWMQRRGARATLRKLDDHMLRDIGMSSDVAHEECSKPFWKE